MEVLVVILAGICKMWLLVQRITGQRLFWNGILANNTNLGSHTPGGCTTCLGAVTITNSTSYTKNVAYYIIGQISKFVKAGALRVGTSSTNGSITSAGFKNTDGSLSLLVYNAGGAEIQSELFLDQQLLIMQFQQHPQ